MRKYTHKNKSQPTPRTQDVITLAQQHIAPRYENTVKSDAPLITYIGEGEHDMQHHIKAALGGR